jgi:hypothetical protein
MKKNILKGTFLAAFMAMAASVNAQNVLTMDELTIAPGETQTVTINLTSETLDVGMVEFTLVFPEGFTLVPLDDSAAEKKAGNKTYKGAFELVEDHLDGDWDVTFTHKFKKGVSQGFYVNLMAKTSDDCLAEDEGAIFKFDVMASSEVASGEATFNDITVAMNDLTVLTTTSENGIITVGGAEPKFEATIASSGRTVAFCADKALDFTSLDGVTAWVVAKFTAAQSWLVPVEKVPAMTAVVLEGPAGKVEIPTTDEAVEAPEVNLLQPVTEAFTISEAQYGKIWVMSGGKFKKAAVGLNIPVGKAYVELDEATAKLIGDELDIAYGEPTGIETINAQLDDNAPIYNLNGVRVNKLQKGVYIQNGHKFIVK